MIMIINVVIRNINVVIIIYREGLFLTNEAFVYVLSYKLQKNYLLYQDKNDFISFRKFL